MHAILQLNPKWETELCLSKAPLGWTMVSWSFLIEQSRNLRRHQNTGYFVHLCYENVDIGKGDNGDQRRFQSSQHSAWCPLLWSQVCTVAEPPGSRPAGASTPVEANAFSLFHWLLAASNHKIPKIHWITYWNYRIITRLTSCLGRSWVFLGHNSILLQQQMFCQTKNIRSDPSTEQSMMWSMLAPCRLAFEA